MTRKNLTPQEVAERTNAGELVRAVDDPRLKRVIYVVEATHQEVTQLWCRWSKQAASKGYGAGTVDWHGNAGTFGWVPEVGRVELKDGSTHPVMMGVDFVEIENKLVLFFSSESRFVDRDMMDAWLKKHVPIYRKRNTTTANFRHVIDFIRGAGPESSGKSVLDGQLQRPAMKLSQQRQEEILSFLWKNLLGGSEGIINEIRRHFAAERGETSPWATAKPSDEEVRRLYELSRSGGLVEDTDIIADVAEELLARRGPERSYTLKELQAALDTMDPGFAAQFCRALNDVVSKKG